MTLFPLADYWCFYAEFIIFVIGVLIIDLGVFHHEAHVVKFREVFSWSAIWVALTVVFGFLLGEFAEYRFAHDARLLTTAGFNRRMRKTACPVVWKAHGAQSPWAHPIEVGARVL